MADPRLHVAVDHQLCQGIGYCARVAPTVFDVRDDARSDVLVEFPGEDLRDVVEEAAALCPNRAISY